MARNKIFCKECKTELFKKTERSLQLCEDCELP